MAIKKQRSVLILCVNKKQCCKKKLYNGSAYVTYSFDNTRFILTEFFRVIFLTVLAKIQW